MNNSEAEPIGVVLVEHGRCLTIEQLSKVLGCSRQSLWNWRTSHGMPTVRAAAHRLVPIAAFLEWVVVEGTRDSRRFVKEAQEKGGLTP